MTEEQKKAKKSIWRHRGRMFASGLNVIVSIVMATIAAGMVNYLSLRYHERWDWSWRDYYRISDKTRGMLSTLNTDVDIVALFQQSHRMFKDVSRSLKEYEYENARLPQPRLRIQIVDTDRDLGRARELARKYDIKSSNIVVFDVGGKRRKYVEAKELFDEEITLTAEGYKRRMVSFKGEQVFSSAIMSVAQTTRPVVYFLGGHGERRIDDFDRQTGYARLATQMARDNTEVKQLTWSDQQGLPADCSLLVIAGPDRRISKAEVDIISSYLNKNGRLLALMDPVVNTGLEGLLEEWGVSLTGDVVVGGPTLTGKDLWVNEFGEHPVTKLLRNLAVMFYMPRSVEPVPMQQPIAADRPRVTVLAYSSKAFANMNPNENPPRFNSGADRAGPVSVAVAVEKGPTSPIAAEVKPTRIVVIGDSSFVSNDAISGALGGGNIDFFMSAVNWLLEREALMAVSPKVPGELRLGMDAMQLRMAFLLIVGGIPFVAAILGVIVWMRRR